MQISGWLKRQYPEDPSLRVSHETIYRSLFIQARGALKQELVRHLVQVAAAHPPLAALPKRSRTLPKAGSWMPSPSGNDRLRS